MKETDRRIDKHREGGGRNIKTTNNIFINIPSRS